jgi:hypothetical protein
MGVPRGQRRLDETQAGQANLSQRCLYARGPSQATMSAHLTTPCPRAVVGRPEAPGSYTYLFQPAHLILHLAHRLTRRGRLGATIRFNTAVHV